jgi:hypothetical protein
MLKVTMIDYTTWRKGKRVTTHTKIAVCPKCGRKGEHQPAWTDKKGKRWPATYNHVGEQDNIFGFISVQDWCRVEE